MARIRTIKPGFFLNEDLAALPAMTRLFFIGLWSQVDREGRCEDRPKRLKASLFPYEDVDVEGMILELVANGHLTRYSVGGVKILSVNNFLKHQRPHHKEDASILPPIPADFNHESSMSQARVKHESCKAVLVPQEGNRKGREQEGKGMDMAPAALTPIQKVVRAYKAAKRIDVDDKAWDRENFPRGAKAAKSLIECFGDHDKAMVFIIGKGQEFDDKGLDWTLETIKKHAWDSRGKINGHSDGEMVPDRLLEPRGRGRIAQAGAIVKELMSGGSLHPPDAGQVQPDSFLAAEDGFDAAGE